MTGRVVSVGLLTSYIRELFDQDRFLADVWVEGEVSDVFRSRAGHVYFTVMDAESQLRCVLFRGQAARQRHAIRAGDSVSAHGRVTIYPRDGQYQLYADAVQPAGIGLLALELELLRQGLEAEGLFDPSRKRPVPVAPRCIGVVTSPDGAVWHDIQQVLQRRYPLVELLLAPATVQGDRAAATIVAALEALQADGRPDVIIVARGGGSAEDLWCFNDERVVRAVFACRVPVVSGVGHETDWTLIDEVADMRAPTPSAAAELCSPSVFEIRRRLAELCLRLGAQTTGLVRAHEAAFRHQCRDLERAGPRRMVRHFRDRIVDRQRSSALVAHSRIVMHRTSVRSLADRATVSQRAIVNRREVDVRVGQAQLKALDPHGVLKRGFAALARGNDGRAVFSIQGLMEGDNIEATLADGRILTSVEGVSRRAIGEGAR